MLFAHHDKVNFAQAFGAQRKVIRAAIDSLSKIKQPGSKSAVFAPRNLLPEQTHVPLGIVA